METSKIEQFPISTVLGIENKQKLIRSFENLVIYDENARHRNRTVLRYFRFEFERSDNDRAQ